MENPGPYYAELKTDKLDILARFLDLAADAPQGSRVTLRKRNGLYEVTAVEAADEATV